MSANQQPWAWLILHAEVLQRLDIPPKTLENRGWATAYRGPLLLHAGKSVDTGLFKGNVLSEGYWVALFGREAGSQLYEYLPKGKDEYERGILGCCTLVDVVTWSENPWYRGDQYGFVLEDIRVMPEPLAYTGKQGIFYVPDWAYPFSPQLTTGGEKGYSRDGVGCNSQNIPA